VTGGSGRFWERKIVSGAIGAKTKFSSKIDGAYITLNCVHCKAAFHFMLYMPMTDRFAVFSLPFGAAKKISFN
jgi:hypothetical protein